MYVLLAYHSGVSGDHCHHLGTVSLHCLNVRAVSLLARRSFPSTSRERYLISMPAHHLSASEGPSPPLLGTYYPFCLILELLLVKYVSVWRPRTEVGVTISQTFLK